MMCFLSLHHGKVVASDGIALPDGQLIKLGDACKYLGILEFNDIKHTLMISK